MKSPMHQLSWTLLPCVGTRSGFTRINTSAFLSAASLGPPERSGYRRHSLLCLAHMQHCSKMLAPPRTPSLLRPSLLCNPSCGWHVFRLCYKCVPGQRACMRACVRARIRLCCVCVRVCARACVVLPLGLDPPQTNMVSLP